jgi:hypothetical protein
MPMWIMVQVLLDIGLVGLLLWWCTGSNALVARPQRHLMDLLQSAELKTAQLQAQLQRADEALRSLQGADSEPASAALPPLVTGTNPYAEASRLAQQGYTVEEIIARVKLPRSEVDLIKRLQGRAQVYT